MTYKDLDTKRQYQNAWMWRRRLSWILANGPCHTCGGTQDLQVVYRDLTQKKIKVSGIWSLSAERRALELVKCTVLCTVCYQAKRKAERLAPIPCGTDRKYGRGCKCAPCKRAHADVNNARRQAKRAAAASAQD